MPEEIPFQVQVSDEDKEKLAMAQQITPEDYFQYRALLIEPYTIQNITKKQQILLDILNRNLQLGNLSKEEYEKYVFGISFFSVVGRFKSTTTYAKHLAFTIISGIITSNSKDGFLRRNEATSVKISKIEQSKLKKGIDRMRW